MVFRFKIVSEETDKFWRELEIDSDASFMSLRDAILDSVGFDHDGDDIFYICDEDWGRHEQILMEDPGSASDEDIWLMDDTRISELVEEKGQHLSFVFDNDADRGFYMALVAVDYDRYADQPVCCGSHGNPPVRVLPPDESELQAEKEKAAAIAAAEAAARQDFDMDDDSFGEDGYNEEDLEGLDDLEF